VAGNLRARLSRIREHAAAPEKHPVASGTLNAGAGPADVLPEDFPEGWSEAGDGVRFKESVRPAGDAGRVGTVRLAAFSGCFDSVKAAPADLVFFDLETTGLSGGSGTVAFLAAFGSFLEDGSMSVRQYFMDDYPSEPLFLECLDAEFAAFKVVVTYNGSSFDLPLYSVRRTMNGLGPAAPMLHVDVLHTARRLWRRTVGNCSLGSIETTALGIERVDDVPGAEVPEVWFDFLRNGRTARLARVFLHNELDVRSLAALFMLIHEAAEGLAEVPQGDTVGLAELQARLDEGLAEKTLAGALNGGESRATRPLMRLYRKQERFAERTALVPRLPDDAAGLFSRSVYAERVRGDLAEAIRLAERSAEAGRGSLCDKALRRATRLAKRLQEGGY